MLQAVEREGASFKRMRNACLTKERRMQNPRAELPASNDQRDVLPRETGMFEDHHIIIISYLVYCLGVGESKGTCTIR